MNPVTINTDASIEILAIDEANSCAVVDDFLVDPLALVEFAAAHASDFERQEIGYPGLLRDVPADATTGILRFLRSRLSQHFAFFKGGIEMTSYLSMATLQPAELAPLQRLCHSDPRQRADRRNFAGLVYLFDNEQLGGTGFYRWKERELIEKATAMEIETPGSSLPFLQDHFELYREAPKYMSGSNEIAELLLDIPARRNRFIFYPGDVPHSAHIPDARLLSTDFSRGRLTLNCFASARPR